nr:MAG TPA: hypothetical protein [Caudoviricetes sp.]
MWNYNDNELYHHGIKGMKWGVRRTDAQLGHDTGKIDLQKTKKKVDAANTIVNETRNINNTTSKKAQKKAQKQKLAEVKSMSDKELRERVNRLNMEQQYIRMSSEQMNTGRANVNSILTSVGTAITVTNSALAIALAIQKLKG